MPDDRTLPCGCTRDGRLCADHRPKLWGDGVASDPLAIVALALFCAMIAVFAKLFGG